MAGEATNWRQRAHLSVASLSHAQKAIAGVLVAVIIAAGVWMTNQASRGPMEPVLDQSFNDADVVQIAQRLSEKKVPHEVRDGKIYVPAERKLEVLSDLIYTDTLTGNTESGFDALVKQSSIFDTPSKTDKMFNHARERMLSGVIGQFKGVRKATVLIDPTSERHINGGSIQPVALVDIQTRGNEASPRQLSSAAVNAVTGAVSTMSRERVKVTIDGASYNLGAEEFGGDVLERRQQCEQAYVTKVRTLLSYIPDVLVSVSVDLNVQTLEEEKHTYDQESSLQLESRRETNTEQKAASTEPANAVLANAVPLIADRTVESVEAPKATRTENVKSDFTVLPAETVQKTHTPAGKETVLSASVVVPRGYFVQIHRRGASKGVEPTDALLQPIIDTQLAKIRHLVRNSLGLKNETDVTVEVYEDGSSAAPLPPVAIASHSDAVVGLPLATPFTSSLTGIWNHRMQWGLGTLGVATLVIASSVMRRGSGATVAPQSIERSTRLPAVPATPALASSRYQFDHEEENDDGADDEHGDVLDRARDGSIERESKPAPSGPFASFHDAEAQTLLDSIRDEHPQTVALVLAHLPHTKAGEILAGLPAAKQVEVVKRIAGIEQTSSEVIEQVEQGLRQRLGHIIGRTIRSGGVSAVAEILNSADRRTEREILHSLEHDAPDLAEQIRRVQSVFDDLLHAPDPDIRAVVEQLDTETIALALRTSRERLVRKVLWNLPGDEAAEIERELQSAEPVRISEIEAAQRRVAEVVERLNTTGEISVLGRRTRREGRKGAQV